MLEDLQNLVRQYAGDAIINNSAIPNERKEEVVADASSSIVSGLKTAIASGNTDDLLAFFKTGGQSSSPVARNIQDGFIHNLMAKFGLDQGRASQIATALIPIVLQKFVHKTNDPNDKSFDLQSIIAQLGVGGGLGSLLNNFGGGDDGGGMLGKIKGMFS